MSQIKQKSLLKLVRNNKAQVLVEYLLLMTIAIGCATLLTKKLIGRESSDKGLVIKAWDNILNTISTDLPDCAKQTNFDSANCPN